MATNTELLLDPETAANLDNLAPQLASLVADSFPLAREQLAGDVDDRIDAQIVIRNLMAIIGRAMLLSDSQLFGGAIQAAVAIWDLGERQAMYPNRPPGFEASLWEGMAIELYALGGLAVRYEKWPELRTIALQQPATTGRETWLRQGQVISARAAQTDMSFLDLAATRLCSSHDGMTHEQCLMFVAQFDLLSALLTTSETEAGRFYPTPLNSAKTSSNRSSSSSSDLPTLLCVRSFSQTTTTACEKLSEATTNLLGLRLRPCVSGTAVGSGAPSRMVEPGHSLSRATASKSCRECRS